MSERPEIQRWTTSLDAPFARKDDGEIVLYADHLRAVTLAKIEALEFARRNITCCLYSVAVNEINNKIAALRKDLGDE